MALQELVNKWALNQEDIQANIELAEEYIKLKQYSAAFTHYMKAAENSPEELYMVHYHCLMMIAYIYQQEGHRWKSVTQFCRFAKACQPDRPEAYYILADTLADELYHNGIYEQWGWIEVYENARIGIMYAESNPQPESYYYRGWDRLYVLYGIALLRLNKHSELKAMLATHEFKDLSDDYVMNTVDFLYNELRLWNPYMSYHVQNDSDNVINPFPGIDKITKNYSQAMQDMFVLTALNGKTNGSYLEIGSADPIYGNNTNLLESEFGWEGISIDFDPKFVNQFNLVRRGKALCLNALDVDYLDLIYNKFGKVNEVDYLQLDIDPAENTLNALYRIPFDAVKFNCITFEHDSYQAGNGVRDASREFLTKYGYILVAPDIKCNNQNAFEDWWVHPSIGEDIIAKLSMASTSSNGIAKDMFISR